MNWEKLKPSHYFKDPVEHIYSQTIFDQQEYDKLYENQNNLEHHVWQEFDKKYKVGFEFKEKFSDIDLDKQVMCLWFFKERSNSTASYVQVDDKQLTYLSNTFLITKSKKISFVETKKKYIRYPLVQLDLMNEQFENIVKRFR
jgi:hypothetical protein